MSLAYWVHTPHPFLIQFTESFGIRYYGLGYVAGFLIAAWLLHRAARAGISRLPGPMIGDFMVALVAGVLLGGRLGHFVFYEPGTLLTNPLAFFKVWEGGMASHGGFLGVTVAVAWYARKHHLSFFHLSDLVVSATPPGLFLVRIANFLNGELWGKPTDVPWAVIFRYTADEIPRHPSQLYEAALEGAVLFLYLQWRFWKTAVVRTRPGQLAGEFLIGYSLLRIIGEIFREPDRGVSLILGLSRGTFYSLFLIIGGLMLVISARMRRP